MMEFTNQIILDPENPTPLAVQLSEQLLSLIASGSIKPGSQLPPVRELAEQVGIHMHTVRAAYRQLEGKGLVSINPGRGTIVKQIDLARLSERAYLNPSFTIAVIQPGFNPFYDSFHQGVEAGAGDSAALFFICNSHDSPSKASAYLKQVIARGVDGIIVVSTDFESDPSITAFLEQEDTHPPVVHADIPTAYAPDILFDLEEGAFRATEHLLNHHHKAIALITPSTNWPNTKKIFTGYKKALCTFYNPEFVISVDGFTIEAGMRGATLLLDNEYPTRAILAADDSIAMGAIRAVQRRGLRVPEDIAIIGFNDIPAAAVISPPLSTIRLPAYEMGYLAMARLKARMDGDESREETIILPVDLVIRRSCGCQ